MRWGLLLLLCLARYCSAETFIEFVDEYFDAEARWSPSTATAWGFHQYDDKMSERSAVAHEKRTHELERFQKRLAELRRGTLKPEEALDAEFLERQIGSELFEEQVTQLWKKNPMSYVSDAAGAVDVVMKRKFAPAGERLRHVIARLKAAPQTVQDLKANVRRPPKEFTDLAIRMAEGSVTYFKDSVPPWAKEAAGNDAALLAEFNAANTAAIQALEQAVAWLKKDLLPKSRGTFVLGAKNFSRMLALQEMVELPLDKLLAIGEANLKKDSEAFDKVAAKVAPGKAPDQAMKLLVQDHPTEADQIPAARRGLERIRKFVLDRQILTIPSDILPAVEETPPFERDGTFASMDTPGAYETKATEAFYYVTPPDKGWDANHKEEHLRAYNAPVMDVITIHEAFPGHYIQFLYNKQFPTKTRKLTGCSSNVEGWAHYCEQMMLDEGFGGDDPKLRLAQLSEALLRDCRFVVGIQMHTRKMSLEEGTRYFVEHGHQEKSNAFEEARRGCYDPLYLYYTLGKLQILKLREDYRKLKGAGFKLAEFHDTLLKLGPLPIGMLRKQMLPGDSGSEL